LRKEAGALVADNNGIYAASLLLRHSDIKTTTETYAAKKSIITTGLEIGLANTTTEAQTPFKGDPS
jgi:phospholipase/lecithinase/hemolysin